MNNILTVLILDNLIVRVLTGDAAPVVVDHASDEAHGRPKEDTLLLHGHVVIATSTRGVLIDSVSHIELLRLFDAGKFCRA